MKKLYPFLLTLLFCANAICQEPEITMTTAKAIGSEISFSLKANASNTPIQIDFGDGNLVSKTIGFSVTSIKGTLVGSQVVKIYGTGIDYLDCTSQQLAILDVRKNPELKQLYSSFNELSELNVAENIALTDLACRGNQLNALDINHNSQLTFLLCSENHLTALDVTQNPELAQLKCNDNRLSVLDLTQNTKLRVLWCFSNQLTTLDLTQNTGLVELHNHTNKLTALDVTKNIALKELGCGVNSITTLDITKNTALRYLSCNLCKLTVLDVTKQTELTELYCDYNQLTQLDLTQNTKLRVLWCFSNQFTTLDLTQNTGLVEFHCHNNRLTTLDVTKNTALKNFNCSFNFLTSLDVTQCGALTQVDCSYNQLAAIDVTSNSELKSLRCASNKFTFITLPNRQTYWTDFIYSSQNSIPIAQSLNIGAELDLSDQKMVNEIATVYTWKTTGGTLLAQGTDYTVTDGKTVFLKSQSYNVYCEMTNAAFPDLTLKTSYTKIISPTAISDLNAPEVEIYAHRNTIYINTPYNGQISVFDTNGKLILSRQITMGLNSIPLRHAGVYMVKLWGGNEMSTKKVFVQ